MQKPNDFDKVSPWGEFEPLPAGGYVCTILNAKEETSKKGNEMVVLMLDIIEGQYKDYFRNLYHARKDASDNPLNVKYPFDGMAYIVPTYNGETTRKFKALCTSVEESGRELAWGSGFADSLKGAEIGVIFRREESRGTGENADKTFWNCKPFIFRSADTIRSGKFSVPDDKPIEEEPLPEGFSNVSESDIPF